MPNLGNKPVAARKVAGIPNDELPLVWHLQEAVRVVLDLGVHSQLRNETSGQRDDLKGIRHAERMSTLEGCEVEHKTFVTVKQTFNSPTVINCLQSLPTQTRLVKEGQALRDSTPRLPSALGRALCTTAASAPPLPKKACKDSCNSSQ